MNRLKRVAALCSETGDYIKDGWLCVAEILSGRTSGTPLGQRERTTRRSQKKPEDERNKKRGATASDVWRWDRKVNPKGWIERKQGGPEVAIATVEKVDLRACWMWKIGVGSRMCEDECAEDKSRLKGKASADPWTLLSYQEKCFHVYGDKNRVRGSDRPYQWKTLPDPFRISEDC